MSPLSVQATVSSAKRWGVFVAGSTMRIAPVGNLSTHCLPLRAAALGRSTSPSWAVLVTDPKGGRGRPGRGYRRLVMMSTNCSTADRALASSSASFRLPIGCGTTAHRISGAPPSLAVARQTGVNTSVPMSIAGMPSCSR